MSAPKHIFVYGTLMRGFPNSIEMSFAQRVEYLGKGRINGEIYEINAYPGLLLNGHTKVYGEVYKLLDDGQVLKELDDYEECSDGFDHPHEYRREIHSVTTNRGPIPCWVYVYNRPIEQTFKKIASGLYGSG